MKLAKPSRKVHYAFVALGLLAIACVILGFLFFTPKAATPSVATNEDTQKSTKQINRGDKKVSRADV